MARKLRNPADSTLQRVGASIEADIAAGRYERAVNSLVNLTASLIRFNDTQEAGREHLRLWKLVGQALQDVEVEFELHPPRTRLLHRR